MPIIAYLVSALVGGFALSIVQGIIKAAVALGIGYVVYQGIDVLMTSILNQISGSLANLPFTGVLGLLKIDKVLNVLASAVAVKFSIKGITNGAQKFLRLK